MELRVLRYFLAVAREQNISNAAESLHLTQPTLSRQLMELEQELGKKLFIRGNRKITLTEDGILFRKRANEIMDLVEKTTAEIKMPTPCVIAIIRRGSKVIIPRGQTVVKAGDILLIFTKTDDVVKVKEYLNNAI